MSTTQIIVGCEVGVGLSERTPGGGLSWRVFIATALGWVWTIIVSLGLCAILFCMGELGIIVVPKLYLLVVVFTIQQAFVRQQGRVDDGVRSSGLLVPNAWYLTWGAGAPLAVVPGPGRAVTWA